MLCRDLLIAASLGFAASCPASAGDDRDLPPWLTEPRITIAGVLTDITRPLWRQEPATTAQGLITLHTAAGDINAMRAERDWVFFGCRVGDRAKVEGYYLPHRPRVPNNFMVAAIVSCGGSRSPEASHR